MRISKLGFGVMRLKQNADGSFPQETINLMHKAYEFGINYFDTGYEYLNEKSESLICDTLVKCYLRESFFIADKLPIWRIKRENDLGKIFSLQLERLNTSYIDFYLLHGLNSDYWKMVKEFKVLDFLTEQKRVGKIHRVGFSFHDDIKTLKMILTSYEWDFCQLQINYYDWYAQCANEKYRICEDYGIPVMIMEPLGGGRLTKLPEEIMETLSKYEVTPTQFGLKFLCNLSNVAVILSGAVNEKQLQENVDTISSKAKLYDDNLYRNIVRVIQSKSTIPCTACRYCVNECPKHIDIPLVFQKYNDSKLLGIPNQYSNFGEFYFKGIPFSQQAHNCIQCRKCMKRCPQKIHIPDELKRVHESAVYSFLGLPLSELREKLIKRGKKLVCFGAGEEGRNLQNILESIGCKVGFFCDNNPDRWNKNFNRLKILSPAQLATKKEEVMVYISSNNYYEDIHRQLMDMGIEICN